MKKYRGRRIDNGEEVKGYFFRGVECIDGIEIPQYHIGEDSYDSEGYDEVDPETVGQETGAKDKNNKEIFGSILINGKMSRGGHIVKAYYEDLLHVERAVEGEVVISEMNVMLDFRDKGVSVPISEFYCDEPEDCEIIGNQWDSELLKDK